MILFSFSICAPRLSLPLLDMHLCSLLFLCFMLCVLFPFYVLRLFCVFHLLHTTWFYWHKLHSIDTTISSMFCIYLSCLVLFHIIHATHRLLWQLYWVFSLSMAYPEILFLLGQCDTSSSLSQLSLSSLLQLQTLTLFHLSIISMISLHSTGSYLETLQILWRSPYNSSSYLANKITPFW